MLRCCWYTCTEHLTSRYVKKIHWVFLVYWISAIFLPIFGIFQCIPPIFTLLYAVQLMLHTFTYHNEHWTCNHTWIASNNVIFCMSCYYNFHLIISYLTHILGFWVTCGVKMMWLCHCWGWQPPQTASHIHIRQIQSAWAHCYAVHGHTVAALHSYSHPTWLWFWGSGSLVESKWCDCVMVEADSHLKLLPASILNIKKCFNT